MKRITYTATSEGRSRADKALKSRGFGSKTNFAKSILIGRSTVTKFFGGKPIQLDCFQSICKELNLDWTEIAGIQTGEGDDEPNQDIQYKITFIISGTLSENSEIDFKGKKTKIQVILEHLEKLCDVELTIIDISKDHSVRLIFGGSLDDLEKLQKLFKSGKLKELLGIPVQDVGLITQVTINQAAIGQRLESITKILIMFPYHGYTDTDPEGRIFWELIDNCRQYSTHDIIVVVNRDTIERKEAAEFINQNKFAPQNNLPRVETLKVWSVDTCQMWLAGWGKIIDDNDPLQEQEKIQRIIQLPGDLEKITNRNEFYKKLEDFCLADCDLYLKRCYDIVIGDFKTEKFVGKSLIDSYGTFPLLANWFPEISRRIFSLPLYKPRSEFLNIRVDTLKELLQYHPFAYEQTLNMLIHSWDKQKKVWKYQIKCFDLGFIQDYSSQRQYQGCLDQVERTERMLKNVWRQTHPLVDTENNQEFKEFMDEYDFLCQRSQAICETARITIRSLLGLGS